MTTEDDPARGRCGRARPLGIALTLLALVVVCTVVELVNPQIKYMYLMRHIPYAGVLAPIDVQDARTRLHKGMTKEEVLSALGRPVGANGDRWQSKSDSLLTSGGWVIWCYDWRNTTEYYYVEFDDGGKVSSFGEK